MRSCPILFLHQEKTSDDLFLVCGLQEDRDTACVVAAEHPPSLFPFVLQHHDLLADTPIRLTCYSGLSIMATFISLLCFFQKIQFAFVSWVHSWPLHCQGLVPHRLAVPDKLRVFYVSWSRGCSSPAANHAGHSAQPMKHAALHPPIRVSSRKKRVPSVSESR
jgi:hypothetical protein